MARTHYSATFPNARPGDQVTWPNTVKVYGDASDQRPMQNAYLDEAKSVSLYSDAASLALTAKGETVTLTVGSPTNTGASDTAHFVTKAEASAAYVARGAAQIDLCKGPYNATAGQDITTALQNAITALAALPNGGEIYISEPGTYLLNGSPQTGTALTYSYNGQVLFPAVTWLNGVGTPIRIRGVTPMSSGALSTAQANGVIIQSNASGAYMFDAIPATSQWGWQWTGIMPMFENIVLRSPTGGTAGGVNASVCLRARYDRVEYDVASNVGNQPTGTLQAFVSPRGLNNGDVTYRDVNVRGAFTGIKLEEHVVLDNVEIIACQNAFEGGEDYHTTFFQYVDVEECANIFHMPTGSVALTVDGSIDVENVVSGGAWNSPCYLVSPTSAASPVGSLRLNLTGSTIGSLALGATAWNLDVSCVYGGLNATDKGGAVGWRQKHPIDDFTRLQGLTLSGYGPGQCFPTMHPWRLGTGTFTVASNTLKSTTAGASAQAFVPTRNGGENRRVTVGVTTGSAGTYLAQIILHRITGGTNSANNIEVRLSSTNLLLLVNGVTRATIAGVITTSTAYTVAADLLYNSSGNPSAVRVWLGGTLQTTYYLTAAESAALAPTGATYPYTEDGLGLFQDTLTAFTSFTVRAVAIDPAVVSAGSVRASGNLTLTGSATLVPGCTLNITPSRAGTLIVTATFDFSAAVGGETLVGECRLGGVGQSGQAIYNGAGAGASRAPATNTWSIPLTADTAQAITLQASRVSGANAGHVANGTHTGFSWVFIPTTS